MDAWETRYGTVRMAAIERLEQLCLQKYHLKTPLPASNLNSKAKKKNVDVSQLKAPEAICMDECALQDRPTVKAGKISVTARPHGLKGNAGPIFAKLVSSRNKSAVQSPEAMSTGGDSERSRSPSPLNKERLDNANISSTTTTTSSSQCSTSEKVDNAGDVISTTTVSSSNSAQDNLNANTTSLVVDNSSA